MAIDKEKMFFLRQSIPKENVGIVNKKWPLEHSIKFENVLLAANSEPLNVAIASGEKIGE